MRDPLVPRQSSPSATPLAAEKSSTSRRGRSFLRRYVGPLVSGIMLCLAAWVLYGELSTISAEEVSRTFAKLPRWAVGASLACVVADYLVISCYDLAALKHIGRTVPYRSVLLASSTATAFSNGIGFTAITSTGMRYRVYSGHGLSMADVLAVMAFTTVMFALGLFLLGGGAMLLGAGPQGVATGFLGVERRLVGACLLGVAGVYVVVCLWRRAPLSIFGYTLVLPGSRMLPVQFCLSLAEWTCASGVLYFLVSGVVEVSFAQVALAYVLAMIAGVISQVPGGLGVFEAVLLTMLEEEGHAELVAVLVTYRLVYFVLPLVVATVVMGGREGVMARLRAVQNTGHADSVPKS